MPDGFQQIGMSILKLFHLVLGIIKTVKGKQLLQGACLKQMATSQLTGKVPSQVKGLLIKRERGRKDGRISKPESKTGTRLYIQEDSELRGSQRRRGPIEETGGAGCSDSEVANRLLCSFSGIGL